MTDHTMPICGDDYPLTEKQQALMALARQLGRDKFAARAAQLDRDAQFPFENYDDMRQAGLLGLCVPEGVAVRLNPREHKQFAWLPWRAAADRCFSPSNAEACLLLPRFAAEVCA